MARGINGRYANGTRTVGAGSRQRVHTEKSRKQYDELSKLVWQAIEAKAATQATGNAQAA